ncbi:g protein-coupled receptor [Anaeramoeba flamelloides]|uniref:G protein-coupled receptor n=1 Tax=Anaeramoeba flamelloides TaxID=1746091 RepID=A0AAV7ZTW1_9EUKA|nr:g protein-coupled receptor [Anaeramoeba flamelloides]
MHKDLIFWLATTSASITLVCCFLIFSLHIRFKSYRSHFFRHLILILTIYDLFHVITFFIPISKGSSLCKIQGHYLSIVGLVAPNFSIVISILTYLRIKYKTTDLNLKKYYYYGNTISLFVPVVFGLVAGFFSEVKQTPNTNWCFISTKSWLIAYYSFLWFDIFLSIVFYIIIIYNITKEIRAKKKLYGYDKLNKSEKENREELKLQVRMSIIPLVLIISLTFSSIKRIRVIINPNCQSLFWLDVMQSITNPSQGFLNCLVFVFLNDYSRQKLRELFLCKKKDPFYIESYGAENDYKNHKLIVEGDDEEDF